MKFQWVLPVLVAALTLPTAWALTTPGFFPIHDDQHVVRLSQMRRAIDEGQLPVRWVSALGFGYGYPLFVFYPPLVYYLGTGLSYLPLTFVEITKLLFAISLIASGVSMYLWARSRLPRFSAVMAALMYVYAPYRAVDVYVRGALAEAMSFVWLPLVFWAIDRYLFGGHKRSLWWYALLLCLSMLTHNLITLPLAISVALYTVIWLLSQPSRERWRKSWVLLAYSVLGLAASSWFWFPALFEKQFTIVDSILLSELYDYRLHFVAPMQLWNSLWGFGGSAPGVLDGMSYKISKPLVLGIVVGLISVLLGIRNKIVRPFLPIAGLTLCSIFMTTAASSLVWQLLSPLSFLQFPWRFLTFVVLFGSILAASVSVVMAASLKKLLSSSAPLAFGVLIGGYAFVLTLTVLHVAVHGKLFTPQTILDRDDAYYLQPEVKSYQVSKTSFEFVPKGVPITKEPQLGITQIDITKDQVIFTPQLRIASGSATIVSTQTKMHHYVFDVSIDQPAQFELTQFAYPGWRVSVDGKQIPIEQLADWPLIGFRLPEGEYTVDIRLTVPWWRRVAELISLVSLGLIGYNLAARPYARKR